MRISIISSEEKALLKSIEESNDSEVSLWKLSNIIIPIITVFLSLASFTVFKKDIKSVEFITYANLLLNGSIPMIALNRIGAMGVYLFKYDKSKEKEFGITDTYYLRTKLFYWFLFVVIGTMFLYIYQVSNNPFSLTWWLILTFSLSILSVFFSVKIAKQVYLLQEKMMENNFFQKINAKTQETKIHLDEKYGE